MLFVLEFLDLLEGVKDRCATITPRDRGGLLFKGEPAVLRFFFVDRSSLQHAEADAAGADLEGGNAELPHELLVNQAAVQGDVGAAFG